MSIAAAQRYSAAQRCPICGGYSTGARGTAAHCFGYLSTDGQYAHCTRTEQAGGLDRHPTSDTFPHRMVGPCRCGQTHGAQATWEKPHVNGNGRKIVATYDYRTAGGDLAYQAVRYEPKDFRQRRPDKAAESGWDWHLADTPRVLYRLPELLAAPKDEPVWIAEGEKDVETLRGMGLVATCNVMGKGKWLPHYGEHLAGRTVLILYDRDKDQGGYRHAQDIKVKLSGYATKAAIIDLPNDAHDVTDWIKLQGGTGAELRRLAHAVLHPDPPIRIYTMSQLRNMPTVHYLLAPYLPDGCLASLVGESGKCKTFLAIEIACRVAQTYGKPVLYVCAEGSSGIFSRAAAWCHRYNEGRDLENLFIITQPVYPSAAQTAQELAVSMSAAGFRDPLLTVLDTLARCYVGDENSTKDMSEFVRGVDGIRRDTKGAVLLVHHTGWDTTRMRGNSSLKGALDVEMRVEQDDLGTITLACTKMKDAMPFLPHYFRLDPVPEVAYTAGPDMTITPCVVVPTSQTAPEPAAMPEDHAHVLAALAEAASKGMGFMEILKASGITRKPTLSGILKQLQAAGAVVAEGEIGSYTRLYWAKESYPSRTGSTGSEPVPNQSKPVRFGSPPLEGEPNRTNRTGNISIVPNRPQCAACKCYEPRKETWGWICSRCGVDWVSAVEGGGEEVF